MARLLQAAALLSMLVLASAVRTLKQELSTVDRNNADGPVFYDPTNPNAFLRFVVIGDFGRATSLYSLGESDECSYAGFGGDQEVQGAMQQRETAVLMDNVCYYFGGCSFIVNTGDNFYDCGVLNNNFTRFDTDWNNVYKMHEKTPYIAGLTWYTTFGNHDIVDTGSVETQIAFTAKDSEWYMPDTNFEHTWTQGNISVTGVFFDSSPFITQYNDPTSPYYQQYYISHHNASYVNQTLAFVDNALGSSNSTYKFTVTHYPLFGTNTEYGGTEGEFNAWAETVALMQKHKPEVYFNGHDHTMTAGNGTNSTDPHTAYITSGAGSWGETGDSCGEPGSYFYSNGGNGGFNIVTVNETAFEIAFFTLGSNFPQCIVTTFADKSQPAVYSANCALGQPNSCCSYSGDDPNQACY